jgi:hypothetical protein
VPAAFTQEQLRAAFARWGLPRALRVDNGTPWGSAGDLPTELALWVIGLGPAMIWNPPCHPQANGVVERSQGTGKRWAEPGTCRDAAELQARLEHQDHLQRERYPSIAGRSRMAAFPALAHSGRAYRADREEALWRLEPVLSHLAEYLAIRRVDGSGTVSLYNRSRYVGRRFSGREVSISLDPLSVEWVDAGPDGTCYRRQKAEELTAERVRRLEVSHHRERRR